MKIKIREKINLIKSIEYHLWLQTQPIKEQIQIAKRLSSIELEHHFGEHKFLDDALWELKWQNGRRIYYAYIAQLNILILLGGNKNGQSKDITLSRKIFKKYIEIQHKK